MKQTQFELHIAYQEIQILNTQIQEENLRMSAELDVACRLQEMILPLPEELQQIKGLDIVGYMKSTDAVGDDYYMMSCMDWSDSVRWSVGTGIRLLKRSNRRWLTM